MIDETLNAKPAHGPLARAVALPGRGRLSFVGTRYTIVEL
jgi:hypothetical protein